MGRLDAKERMREREREWGTRWEGEREGGHAREKRSVAWKVAASELEARRTFAAPGRRQDGTRQTFSLKFALSGVGGK